MREKAEEGIAMRKILLTSSGFETERIMALFLGLFEKKPKKLKALFIPTAAIDAGAIEVLPKCMHDLLRAGIPQENVTVFDLHRDMPYDELRQYDLAYFTGGSPQYLLERINATGFNAPLRAVRGRRRGLCGGERRELGGHEQFAGQPGADQLHLERPHENRDKKRAGRRVGEPAYQFDREKRTPDFGGRIPGRRIGGKSLKQYTHPPP